MKPDLMDQLPRLQREAVESAGYRLTRWMAAREVLQARVTKGRMAGALGDFLTHWLALAPALEAVEELWLSFDHAQEQLKLGGGGTTLATSALEHALLHLPALRSFWSQELRQQHFAALRALVPQAWLLDPASVPPGAVIQGLGTVSWEQTQWRLGQDVEIQDSKGLVLKEWPPTLAAQDSILTLRKPAAVKLKARYVRNEKDQVVLSTIEEAAP